MSKRRKAGDIVWKRENAGFVGEAGRVEIQPDDDHSPCMLDCGDPECREWVGCFAVNAAGEYTGGVACHVSECEMSDLPGMK